MSLAGRLKDIANPTGHLGEHAWDVAGLGVLAAPIVDKMQAKFRAGLAGDKNPHGIERRQFIPEKAHDAIELGGLGILAVPGIKSIAGGLKHASIAFYDELQKLGQITEEDAEAAKARLSQTTPLSGGQLARWATVGAVAKPLLGMGADLIKGGPKALLGGARGMDAVRDIAGDAVTGAVSASLVPIARRALDQHADKKLLSQYQQETPMKTASDVRWAAFVDELQKIAAGLPGPMSAAMFANLPVKGAVTQFANATKAKNAPAVARIGENIMDVVKNLGPKGVQAG